MSKFVIGKAEICHLPDLGAFNLDVRVDTGARTSSLHVDNLEAVMIAKKPHVSFDLHPDFYDINKEIHCCLPIHDIRNIKSSNGEIQKRFIIQTDLQLAEHTWPIEISLTNRQDMTYVMLLGREGMGKKVLVDPSGSYIATGQDV